MCYYKTYVCNIALPHPTVWVYTPSQGMKIGEGRTYREVNVRVSDETTVVLVVMVAVVAAMFLVGVMLMCYVSYDKERQIERKETATERAKKQIIRQVLASKPYLVGLTLVGMRGEITNIEDVRSYMMKDSMLILICEKEVIFFPLDALLSVRIMPMPEKIPWETEKPKEKPRTYASGRFADDDDYDY